MRITLVNWAFLRQVMGFMEVGRVFVDQFPIVNKVRCEVCKQGCALEKSDAYPQIRARVKFAGTKEGELATQAYGLADNLLLVGLSWISA